MASRSDWALTVVHASLPTYHQFEQETYTVELAAAGDLQVDLVAVSVDRQLQILSTGELWERPEADRDSARAPLDSLEPDKPSAGPDRQAEWTTFRMPLSGGSLMQVADWLYSEAERWPKIWVANQDAVADPGAVPPGTLLRIPPNGPLTDEELAAARGRRPPGGGGADG